MKQEHFLKVVEEALDSLPQEFRSRIKNVAILVEDFPPNQSRPQPGQQRCGRSHPARLQNSRFPAVLTGAEAPSRRHPERGHPPLLPEPSQEELRGPCERSDDRGARMPRGPRHVRHPPTSRFRKLRQWVRHSQAGVPRFARAELHLPASRPCAQNPHEIIDVRRRRSVNSKPVRPPSSKQQR
jgi:hypothetical protein